MESRGDGAWLKPVIVRLARDGGLDRLDLANRLREHLHARGTLDEDREHGRLLDRRGRDHVIAIDGIEAPKRNAAEITNAALDGTCPTARAALDLFCAMLGTFAGNVALMFGAQSGVFIAGGIAPRLTEYIARSEFRTRFEHKGRFRQYLASIPSSIIVHPAATFIGLKSIAERAPGYGN